MDEFIISLVSRWNGYGLLLFTVITVVIAGVLSSCIGLEREMKGQAAGLRTHVIVTIGCCLLMTLSIYAIKLATKDQEGFSSLNYDAARIAAGILSGIGFMGAGSIVKNGLSIRGLTTASTIWLCSAIGMACGCGFVLEAIAVTLIAMGFLVGLSKLEKGIDKRSPRVRLSVAPNVPLIHELRSTAEKDNLVIKNITTAPKKDEQGRDCTEIILFFAYQSNPMMIADFVEKFTSYPYVYSISQEHKHGKKDNEISEAPK